MQFRPLCDRAGQWLAEAVATFGLIADDLRLCRATPPPALCGRPLHHLGLLVHGLDILRQSGVTIARALSNTFAGIAPGGVMAFILAQLAGAAAAVLLARWLLGVPERRSDGDLA